MDASSSKSTILPIYSCSDVNAAISLYSGRIELNQNSQVFSGAGRISFEWLPTPHVHFSINCDPPHKNLNLGNVNLTAPGISQIQKATISSLMPRFLETGFKMVVEGRFSVAHIGQGNALTRCVFHLPNFSTFLGKASSDPQSGILRRSQAVLESGNHRITLDEPASVNREFSQRLKKMAGYGITHVGQIETTDNQPLSNQAIQELLGNLTYYMSFCRGFWVAPLLVVGFDSTGNRDWEEWKDYQIERWQSGGNWFSCVSESCIEEVYPGFTKRMNNDTWTESIRLAIWWYVAGNLRAGGFEGSLILLQAALELLAWTYLVEDTMVLSKNGFDNLPASDRLRLVLSGAQIPIQIPDELDELSKLSTSLAWQDGPHALTELRNGPVHPTPKKRRIVLNAESVAVFDAWSLSIWYLELLLLWLFEFRGKYENRLKRLMSKEEAVEMVPWARNDQ